MSLMPTTSVKSDGSLFLDWNEPTFPVAPVAPVITARAPSVRVPEKAKTDASDQARALRELSDHERAILAEFGATYEIRQWRGQPIIFCLVCRRDSFSEDDRANRYCGPCNAFHDDRLAAWEAEKLAQSQPGQSRLDQSLNGTPAGRAKETHL